MFSNPFVELSASIPPAAMQWFVVLMAVLVVAGTLFDVIHKRSAQYFFENMEASKARARREVSGGEKVSLAVQTAVSEVLTSSEFCNPKRRVAHLLTMYGLVIHIIATVALTFGYPTAAEAGIWPLLWHLGALAVCVGGYWFWFFIRVDVAAEGSSPFRLMRADLFILSLLASMTMALLWSWTQGSGIGWLFFVLYIAASVALFGGVPWSKFAHMFFKPAAAFQKKVTKADGSQENLPDLGELTDPELQAKYPDIPTYMGEKPSYMGLGIKRETPNHY
jgi:hypothetical protein